MSSDSDHGKLEAVAKEAMCEGMPAEQTENSHILNEPGEDDEKTAATVLESAVQPPFNKYFSNTSSLFSPKYLGNESSWSSNNKKQGSDSKKSSISRRSSSAVKSSLSTELPDTNSQNGHAISRRWQNQMHNRSSKRPLSYDAESINVRELAESIEQQGVRGIQSLLEDEQIKTYSLIRRLKERDEELKAAKLELAKLKSPAEEITSLNLDRSIIDFGQLEFDASDEDESSHNESEEFGFDEDLSYTESQSIREQLEKARRAKRATKQKLHRLQNHLDTTRTKARILQQEKQELQAQLTTLQKQLSEALSDQKDLESQLSLNFPDERSVVEDAAANNAKARIAESDKADHNSWLQGKLEELRSQIEVRKREIHQKTDKIQTLEDELEDCRVQMARLEEGKSEWRRTFERLTRTLKRMTQPSNDKTQLLSNANSGTSRGYQVLPTNSNVEIAQSIRPHYAQAEIERDAADLDYEHAVTILLLAARISLTCTNDYYKSLALSDKASSVARQSRLSEGLQARCAYWTGRAQLELQLYPESIASLETAMAHLNGSEGLAARVLLAKARDLAASANDLPGDQQPEG